MGVELLVANYLNNFKSSAKDLTACDSKGSLKTCLKSKILRRRKERGLAAPEIDFAPRKPLPMTEEEKEKDRKRKQSNRESALRCRKRQKEEWEWNKKIVAELRAENQQLLNRYQAIEEEKNKYIYSLRKMVPEAQIHGALRQINYSTVMKPQTPQDGSERPGPIVQNENEATSAFLSATALDSIDRMESIRSIETLSESSLSSFSSFGEEHDIVEIPILNHTPLSGQDIIRDASLIADIPDLLRDVNTHSDLLDGSGVIHDEAMESNFNLATIDQDSFAQLAETVTVYTQL